MSTLVAVKASTIACRCGCGRTYPLYSGLLEYGSGSEVAFRAGHFWHPAQTHHLWLLLGSGPWFADDARGCWLILDSWIHDAELIARVEDPESSPFESEHIFDERFLTRSEVLARAGALEWAIGRRDELIQLHTQTRRFTLGESVSDTN